MLGVIIVGARARPGGGGRLDDLVCSKEKPEGGSSEVICEMQAGLGCGQFPT